jgi:cation diffusion facilitator family transporter
VTTVIVAGGANLAIAVAKVVAGVLSGSSAMLSEAAHSFADTTTEVLLFVALRRGNRPSDASHPFGHGRSAFVWALLAAMFTLVAGAGFSVTHGVHTTRDGEELGDLTACYIILAVAFVLESVSLAQSLRQARRSACRSKVSPVRFLRLTSNTTQLGIAGVLVAARVGFVDTVSTADVQRPCELGEQRLRAAFPTIKQVFLDPTGASS